MRKDAEEHAEEDKKLREQAEVRNNADASVFRTEKFLREQKDTVGGDQRKKLEDAMEKVKKALKGNDVEAIKSAEAALTDAWHAVSSEIYSKVREKAGAGAAPGEKAEAGAKKAGKEGEVVDADFEMVDEDKKK